MKGEISLFQRGSRRPRGKTGRGTGEFRLPRRGRHTKQNFPFLDGLAGGKLKGKQKCYENS